MKTLLALSLMLVCFVFLAFGQSAEPIQSNIEAIKSKTRVFVVADKRSVQWRLIRNSCREAGLEVVDKAEKAQFILEYNITYQSNPRATFDGLTGYSYNKKNQKIIYWSETKVREKSGTVNYLDNLKGLMKSFLNQKSGQ